LHALRADVRALVAGSTLDESERERLLVAVDARFGAARFPFAHERVVPRITVAGTSGDVHLGPGWRKPRPWTDEAKRALIEKGYELTDAEFDAAGLEATAAASEPAA
jgi:hypothetical protein